MIIAKNGTQYNEITNEIIKAHATYVNSPFVKVTRALNYRDVNGHKILVDDFTPEELKAGLAEIAKIADAQTRELYINKFFSRNKSEAQQIITRTLTNKDTYNKTEVNNLVNAKANANATVNLTGNQNIAGVKTFSSPIVVPNPTANNQVANKAYVDSRINRVNITKASWGVNWNAPIMVNGHTPLTIPNDGVIFLWGGENFMNFGHPNDTKISAFQFTPKNYTAMSGMYSKLFSKSPADGRETITEDPTENSFFLFGLGSHFFTESTIHPLTTTLSFLPVRQGDKVFLQFFNRFGREYYYLFGIFFPFER